MTRDVMVLCDDVVVHEGVLTSVLQERYILDMILWQYRHVLFQMMHSLLLARLQW